MTTPSVNLNLRTNLHTSLFATPPMNAESVAFNLLKKSMTFGFHGGLVNMTASYFLHSKRIQPITTPIPKVKLERSASSPHLDEKTTLRKKGTENTTPFSSRNIFLGDRTFETIPTLLAYQGIQVGNKAAEVTTISSSSDTFTQRDAEIDETLSFNENLYEAMTADSMTMPMPTRDGIQLLTLQQIQNDLPHKSSEEIRSGVTESVKKALARRPGISSIRSKPSFKSFPIVRSSNSVTSTPKTNRALDFGSTPTRENISAKQTNPHSPFYIIPLSPTINNPEIYHSSLPNSPQLKQPVKFTEPLYHGVFVSLAKSILAAGAGCGYAFAIKVNPLLTAGSFAISILAHEVIAKISHSIDKTNPVRVWTIQTVGQATISGISIVALHLLKITNCYATSVLSVVAFANLIFNLKELSKTSRNNS